MQRGAILLSIGSILLMNIFILKRRFNLIAVPLTILIPTIIFKFISSDKQFFGMSELSGRLGDQFYWYTSGEFSPHMYALNLFSKYGFLGIFFIYIFYTILIRLLINHQKYNNSILPKHFIFKQFFINSNYNILIKIMYF